MSKAHDVSFFHSALWLKFFLPFIFLLFISLVRLTGLTILIVWWPLHTCHVLTLHTDPYSATGLSLELQLMKWLTSCGHWKLPTYVLQINVWFLSNCVHWIRFDTPRTDLLVFTCPFQHVQHVYKDAEANIWWSPGHGVHDCADTGEGSVTWRLHEDPGPGWRCQL